ncbi:MAG TPA: hypothetical protein VEA59_06085 [Patescibacteria group bacterium]|nr:hypothetical protein [Patescibacteria group bacterium]
MFVLLPPLTVKDTGSDGDCAQVKTGLYNSMARSDMVPKPAIFKIVFNFIREEINMLAKQ